MQNKPNISKIAFWDSDFDNLDFEENSLFIMSKVFNYGTWADIVAIFKYYGSERISNEIVKTSYLKQKTLSFLCVVLHLEQENFVCYQRSLQRKSLWNE